MTRTITTADLLDALPVKAVLLDEGGWPVWRDPHEGWCASNGTHDIPADLLIADGAPLTILHDPSAPAPAPSVAPEAAVEALREWGVDESDVTALREAAVEAAAWKLIDCTSDLADRAPSDETVRAALTDARAALPHLTAAPSATREEVRDEVAGHPIGSGYYATTVGVDEAAEIADALLARFNMTPKEDR